MSSGRDSRQPVEGRRDRCARGPGRRTLTPDSSRLVVSTPTADLAPRICPGCGASGTTRFCGECGHALTLGAAPPIRELVREGAAEIIGFDRRLLATIRDLLVRPARVVAEQIAGRGGAYVHPLKLFLSLAGLYMVCLAWFQPFSFEAVSAATDSPYEVSLTEVVLGARTPAELRAVFAEHGLTEAEADERFQGRMNAATPLATVLALVPLALLLGVLYRDRPRRDHWTFLLVVSNAIWVASLIVLPLILVSRAAGIIATYVAVYGYLAVGFFGVYQGPTRLGVTWRFAVVLVADVVITAIVDLILAAGILASVLYP